MKVALLASNDLSLLNFRGELIRNLIGEGHEVLTMAPRKSPAAAERLRAIGARYVETALDPQGMNPWRDLAYRRGLARLFRQHGPDLLLAYTIKPVVHGCPAARQAGIPRVFALITGLGAAFNTRGLKGRVLTAIATRLYRAAFRDCTRVIVQNSDIARFFAEQKLVDSDKELTVVNGSGVDTSHFAAAPGEASSPRFLFLGRLLWDKGIREFSAAAKVVKQTCPNAEFWVAGSADENPAAMTREELRRLQLEGIVQYFDFVDDVRPFLRRCSALVLPSYHEGMPRSVLEAMATARPVITTDAIGCRETIFEIAPGTLGSHGARRGRNGILVPVRSAGAVADAMLHLAAHPDVAAEMGLAGRGLAETHFDVRKINQQMLAAMGLKPAPASVSAPR